MNEHPAREQAMSPETRVRRVRHEIVRRTVSVSRLTWLSPAMLRVTLTGEELRGFLSLGYDDHVKLFFDRGEGEKPAMRDYTPRRYDPQTNELDIDFAVNHEAGPATEWARNVQVGSLLNIAGPRGSQILEDSFDWNMFICDETGLPAASRRLEELRADVPVVVVAETTNDGERIALPAREKLDVVWVVRGEGPGLTGIVRGLKLPAGAGHVWIAAESAIAKELRRIVVDELGHPLKWLKAAGYWQRGAEGVHEPIGA